jgi:hypothetical protein
MYDRTKFSDPYASVDIQPVSVAGKEIEKIAVRVKDDAGEEQVVGILSKDYNLIKNSIVRDIEHDIISRSGMGWKNLKTLWDGKRYVNYFYSENALTTLKNGAEYPLHLGMMSRNAYDGSGLFALEFYIMNMACLNQFINSKQMGRFAIRHIAADNFDITDAVQNINISSNKLVEIAPKYQAMIQAPLSVEDIVNARNAEMIPDIQWGNAISQLGNEPDQGKLFGLYQALTFVTSHKMAGMNAIKAGNNVTEHFMSLVA